MKTIILLFAVGIITTLASCERCGYCRCYDKTYKYCEKDYSPETFENIRTTCQRNEPYCNWFYN